MTSKYMLDWHDNGTNNAAGKKAKDDVMYFLHRGGWCDIPTTTNKYAKVLWSMFVAPFKFATTKADYILVQFSSGMPMLRQMNIDNIKRFSKAKLIILIHDIETLRGWNDGNSHRKEVNGELALLKKADGIIVHSDNEKQFLAQHHVKAKMIVIPFFDYYTDCPMQLAHSYQKTICWAGNTVHADFLQKLTIKHRIDVYGTMVKFNNPAIIYQGNYPATDLPRYLHADFGLVWNGTSVHTCDGAYGNYMRYNSPHKASLYLSCGMPIITWSQAALAEQVIKYQVGLVIDDLDQLDELLDSITSEQYQKLQQNVRALGKKIREGYFFNHVTAEIINMM